MRTDQREGWIELGVEKVRKGGTGLKAECCSGRDSKAAGWTRGPGWAEAVRARGAREGRGRRGAPHPSAQSQRGRLPGGRQPRGCGPVNLGGSAIGLFLHWSVLPKRGVHGLRQAAQGIGAQKAALRTRILAIFSLFCSSDAIFSHRPPL